MSKKMPCRLCLKTGFRLYRSLFDGDGLRTEVFELVVKYFTLEFLENENGKHFTRICKKCWDQIYKFHAFHELVLQAQTKLKEKEIIGIPEQRERRKTEQNEKKSMANFQENAIGNISNDLATQDNSMDLSFTEESVKLEFYDEIPGTSIALSSTRTEGNKSGEDFIESNMEISLECSNETECKEKNRRISRDLRKAKGKNQIMQQKFSLKPCYARSDCIVVIDDEEDNDKVVEIDDGHDNTEKRDTEKEGIVAIVESEENEEKGNNQNANIVKFNKGISHNSTPLHGELAQRTSKRCRSGIDGLPVTENNQKRKNTRSCKEKSEVEDCDKSSKKLRLTSGYDCEDSIEILNEETKADNAKEEIQNTHKRKLNLIHTNNKENSNEILDGEDNKTENDFLVQDNTNHDTTDRDSCCNTDSDDKDITDPNLHKDQFDNCEDIKYDAMTEDEISSDLKDTKKKRIYKPTYIHKIKHPKTVEEFDDFISKWRENLECVICNQPYSKFSLLLQHFSQEHPADQCYISCCQLRLYHRFEIENHIHYHNQPDAFKCQVCCKCFATKKSLRDHLLQYHAGKSNELEFQCSSCLSTFKHKSSLNEHRYYFCKQRVKQNSKGQFKCDQCERSYCSLKVLRRHCKNIHTQVEKLKKFKCSICDKTYDLGRDLRDHIQTKHKGQPAVTCSFCPKSYSHKSTLHAHIIKEHHQQYENIKRQKADRSNTKISFACNKCSNVYQTRLALVEHEDVMHAGKLRYPCKFCSKEYRYSSNLSLHVKRAHKNQETKRAENKENTNSN